MESSTGKYSHGKAYLLMFSSAFLAMPSASRQLPAGSSRMNLLQLKKFFILIYMYAKWNCIRKLCWSSGDRCFSGWSSLSLLFSFIWNTGQPDQQPQQLESRCPSVESCFISFHATLRTLLLQLSTSLDPILHRNNCRQTQFLYTPLHTLFSRPAALVQIIEPAFSGRDGAAS